MIFCVNEYKKDLMLCGLSALLKNNYKTVKCVLDLSKLQFSAMKDALSVYGKSNELTDVTFKRKIIQTIMRISDLINDRSLSHIVHEYDLNLYMEIARTTCRKNIFKSIAPYWGLFNNYIKNCIVLFKQKAKQHEITNQFTVNPTKAVEIVLDEIESSLQSSDNNKKFNNEQTYQVYESEKAFQHNIILTNIETATDNFQVQLFNDCIYDVMGSKQHGLFDEMTWTERLKQLETSTPKIRVEDRQGSVLNDDKRTVYMGVSWLENGKYRYITLHKKAVKKSMKN